jgi:hypothetical protein
MQRETGAHRWSPGSSRSRPESTLSIQCAFDHWHLLELNPDSSTEGFVLTMVQNQLIVETIPSIGGIKENDGRDEFN